MLINEGRAVSVRRCVLAGGEGVVQGRKACQDIGESRPRYTPA